MSLDPRRVQGSEIMSEDMSTGVGDPGVGVRSHRPHKETWVQNRYLESETSNKKCNLEPETSEAEITLPSPT